MRAARATKTTKSRRQVPRANLTQRYEVRLNPCDGRSPLSCHMLDFSITGVRLRLPKDVQLPTDVQVLIGNLSHNARVAWRKADVVGIDLIDEHHSIY